MSDMVEMLVETASRQFGDLCTKTIFEDVEAGKWPEGLWSALEQSGLTAASASEERGGVGADLADVLALVKCAASYAAPVPLAETLLAEYLLAAAGLPRVNGPLTIGPVLQLDRVSLRSDSSAWVLNGTMHRIPWARQAEAIVVVADGPDGPATVVVRRPPLGKKDSNYAGEPRDTVTFSDHRVPQSAIGRSKQGWGYEALYAKGALFRVVAMAGALEKVLELTVQYAKDRVQFGRPIGKFQAIQQQIAVLAEQVAASGAVAQAAGDAAAEGKALFEIAAAKARVGEAAGISAAIAHQVHGAIGFTQEHALQRSTRRLWSWRDEFGSETEWMGWIGHIVAQVGGEGLWPFLTEPEGFFDQSPSAVAKTLNRE